MKKVLFLLAIIFFGAIVVVMLYVNANFKKVSEIGGFQKNDITKITFQYDNPNIKGGTTENKEKIDKFLKYINSYTVTKKWIQKPSTGYTQMALFYNNNKFVMSLLFYDKFIEINGVQYNIIKGTLNSKDVDDFISSIR